MFQGQTVIRNFVPRYLNNGGSLGLHSKKTEGRWVQHENVSQLLCLKHNAVVLNLTKDKMIRGRQEVEVKLKKQGKHVILLPLLWS